MRDMNRVYSGCIALVQWAREQIERYAEMFKKQVHGSDVASQTVQDCIEITRLQSNKVSSRVAPCHLSQH